MGLESKRSNRLLTSKEHNMKEKIAILLSIILIIASAIMLTLAIVHKNIGLVVYNAFLVGWNIINLIIAIKLLKDD